MDKMKVALIGLDTSHAVEFPRWMQDPAVPAALRVRDLCATRCLRFETPFQNRKGLDERQAYLERIGVMVTEEFDAAVADCDALMIEINDPARHLEYFEKCAGLGLPIFLDKPFADTPENARRIMRIACVSSPPPPCGSTRIWRRRSRKGISRQHGGMGTGRTGGGGFFDRVVWGACV